MILTLVPETVANFGLPPADSFHPISDKTETSLAIALTLHGYKVNAVYRRNLIALYGMIARPPLQIFLPAMALILYLRSYFFKFTLTIIYLSSHGERRD